MRRFILALAFALALPCAVQAKNQVGQIPFATTARDTLKYTSPADTLGPAFIGGCDKVRINGSWKGDSLAVYVEMSTDRVNWSTPYTSFDGDLLGTAATQGNYLSTVLNDFAPAAAATIGSTASALLPWVRVRFVCTHHGPGGHYTLNLSGRISCVQR